MRRVPVVPVEVKTRIVLAVLAGEVSIAEAARKEKVSENSGSRRPVGDIRQRALPDATVA